MVLANTRPAYSGLRLIIKTDGMGRLASEVAPFLWELNEKNIFLFIRWFFFSHFMQRRIISKA
jgi:hypothetical protein